jgi:hypothetical protein
MGKRLRALVCGALLTASSAQAAQVLVTYSGTVETGYDAFQFFKTGSDNLAGQGFALEFVLDTGTAGAVFLPFSTSAHLYGFDASNPLSVSFTLNGKSLASAPAVTSSYGIVSYHHQHMGQNLGGGGYYNSGVLHHYRETSGEGNELSVLADIYDAVPITGTLDLKAPLTYFVQPGATAGGQLSFTRFDSPKPVSEDEPWNFSHHVTAKLSLQSLAITSIAAVPEPSTWAMMILGFGAVGTAMRLSSRRAALAAA